MCTSQDNRIDFRIGTQQFLNVFPDKIDRPFSIQFVIFN